MRSWPVAAAFFLFAFHLIFGLSAIQRLSPTWDEIVYPAAGFAQWKTHSLELNTEHPFLSKLLISFPLLFLPVQPPKALSAESDEYRLGFRFIYRNTVAPTKIIFWSRLPCLVFSLFTAAILFLWIRSLWGPWSGVLSLLCYVTTPILASRASLALLEGPMCFFILISLMSHSYRLKNNKNYFLIGSGVSLGLACLCKLDALPLLLVLFVIELFPSFNPKPLSSRIQSFVWLLGSAVFTLGVFYSPWKNSGAAMAHAFGWLQQADKSVAAVPYYWHGRHWNGAPALLSLGAWMIKAPLCVLVLSFWGVIKAQQLKENSSEWIHWVVCIALFFLPVLVLHYAVSTVHVMPVYLGLSALAGGCVAKPLRLFEKGILGVLICGAFFSFIKVQPNDLAYFNGLVGGPSKGYLWLSDSDQDWGQSLPEIFEFWKNAGKPALLLSYSGTGDPAAYGIRSQDLLSSALVSRESQSERLSALRGPLMLIVTTKVFQTESSMQWLEKNVRPISESAPCFRAYDIGRDPSALRWVATLYATTGRRSQALWADDRARVLDPGNSFDVKLHALLKSPV